MDNFRHLKGWGDIIHLEDEMVKPGPEREKLKEGGHAWRVRDRKRQKALDKTLEQAHARAVAQSTYYLKNKEKLNEQRRVRNADPHYVYKKAEDRAKRSGIEWGFSFDTWTLIWLDCPNILDENGFTATAWSQKGSNVHECTQMHRVYLDRGWQPDNVQIMYHGVPVPDQPHELDMKRTLA